MITVSAMYPLYKRLGMNPLILAGVVMLGAGVTNLTPWTDSSCYECTWTRRIRALYTTIPE